MNHPRTPRDIGYRMPAEFEPQECIWLAWPHVAEIWPGNHEQVELAYGRLLAELSPTEQIRLIVENDAVIQRAVDIMVAADADMPAVDFLKFPTNDIWMRDNGPIFLTHPDGAKVIVDWGFNGWGDKYGPYDQDDVLPKRIAQANEITCFEPGLILEGGSVEVNGQGLLLTSEQCLLNPNRNGNKNQEDLEPFLRDYFGIEQILWLKHGLAHDHTDGHIDNLARFVEPDHVVAVATTDESHPDYHTTRENIDILLSSWTTDGRPLRVTPIPLPYPITDEPETLSPSYANFIIGNQVVIVPTYGCELDAQVLEILAGVFPTRRVVGLDGFEILRGGGSFHCISQQEPLIGAGGSNP